MRKKKHNKNIKKYEEDGNFKTQLKKSRIIILKKVTETQRISYVMNEIRIKEENHLQQAKTTRQKKLTKWGGERERASELRRFYLTVTSSFRFNQPGCGGLVFL